ncbi:MAG: NADH:ubiquinone reductase (Na(+)-transporting) subunit D [Bacteroidetes bacterium]|nr:NADH:ubiquinone reductase (Na(+)-transporting) subunit D [Bacteroidota bacterium]
MSTEVASKPIKTSEPLFSKKNMRLLSDPLNENNPITVQVLGICSALAVTAQVKPAFIMALAVTFVTAASNVFISLLRNLIPGNIRIIVQLTIVATMVILVDLVLKAYVYDVSKQLSVFVGLIITNCIIMGRLEAFAMGNKPWASFLDGIGNGLGYAAILIIVAIMREILGSGTLLGYQVVPQFMYDAGFANNNLMVVPAGALFAVGIIIWVQRAQNKYYETE